MNMGTILFGNHAEIRVLKKTLPFIFPATLAGISKMRPTTARSNPKASLSLKILDYLNEERLSVAAIPDLKAVYYEIDGIGYMVQMAGPATLVIYTEAADVRPSIVAVGEVLKAMYIDKNEEVCNSIDICAANLSKKIIPTDENLALFCDAMYYGSSKYIKDVRTFNEDVKSQMQMAYRKGSLNVVEKISALKLKAIPLPASPAKEKKTKTVKKADIVKECEEGVYRVPYDWKDKSHIQPVSALKSFVPCAAFESVLKKIKVRTDKVLERMDITPDDPVSAIGKDYINLSLVGKPGTGKTAMAYAISSATGMPVYSVNLSHNTDEDEFQGQTKIVDGKAQFVETDFLNAYTNGGIIILEEVNLANPAVIMGALGQAVEFPFILKRNGYETVRRHPLCIIITTMNVGTAGSKIPSQAFMNRFKQTYTLNDPTKKDFISILCTSGASKAECTWIYEAYDKIVGYLNSDEINEPDIAMTLSLRTCFGAIENIEEGDEPLDAIRHSIIGKIAESDLSLATECDMEVLRKAVPAPTF